MRLAAVVAGGIALRVLYVALTSPRRLGGDPAVFQFTAEHLASGDGYISPVKFIGLGEIGPTAEHPPLFSILLAGAIKLGAGGTTSQRIVLGCLLGGVAIALVGLLARRLAGDRAGLIAGGLAAAYPTLIAADTSEESEPLYGIWLLLALLATYRLIDRRDVRSAALLGAAIGLGALTRNDALLLLPLLALPLAVRAGPGRWRRLALTTGVAAVLLTPWLVRNWIAFDRPVLTTNYGPAVAGANCRETYYGKELGGFWLFCIELQPERNEAAWSADLAHRGLAYARHHAGRVPLVVGVRVLRGWGFYEPGRQLHVFDMPQRLQDVGIPVYYALLALAIAGLVTLRRRGPPLWPLLVPFAATTLVLAVNTGSARFRFGSELAIVVLAGVAIDRLLPVRRAT